MSIFVLYHANCFDGFGAKYAAWRKFGNNAEYIAVNYGQPLPNISGITTLSKVAVGERYQFEALSLVKTEDSETTPINTGFVEIPRSPNSIVTTEVDVYILDFSYPRDVLEELRKRVRTLVVLDHHKTAQEDLKGLDYATFNMNKSGAVLAWEYFHPDKDVPSILLDIQDGDLWKFERPNTEKIRAALPLIKFDLLSLHSCAMYEDDYEWLLGQGESILTSENVEISHRVPKHVHKTTLYGYSCGCINCTTLISKTGSAIVNDETLRVDVALMYQIIEDGKVLLSFRAAKDNDVDVSVLAKEFGGGGHAKAAGGRCYLKTLQNILDGILDGKCA